MNVTRQEFPDMYGRPIEHGCRVILPDYSDDEATVVRLHSEDGDMEEGLVVYFPPKVTVRWGDGAEETIFPQRQRSCDDEICFDEIMVISDRED